MRITLRIPKNVHQQLTDAAGGKRSMNAEIIARLESTFLPEKTGLSDEQVKALARLADSIREEVYKKKGGELRIRIIRDGTVISDQPYEKKEDAS